MPYELNATVRVRAGVHDEDYPDLKLAGWQGRIIEIDAEEALYLVAWDSRSLWEVAPDYIAQCEAEEVEWWSFYLSADEIAPAPPRDTAAAAEATVAHIERLRKASFEDYEQELVAVLRRCKSGEEWEVVRSWWKRLRDHLALPLEAVSGAGGPLQPGEPLRLVALLEPKGAEPLRGEVLHRSERRPYPLQALIPLEEDETTHWLYAYQLWAASR